MVTKRKKAVVVLATAVSLIFLQACSKDTDFEGEKVIRIATPSYTTELKDVIGTFTKQTGYRVEVEEYEKEPYLGVDETDRIKAEIIAGNGPDIIDFGYDYSPKDILGEYTIDLSDMLEDSGIPLQSNFMEAYTYKGKQLVVPTGVVINTLTAPQENINGLTEWNASEMIEAYKLFAKDDSNRLFYPDATKATLTGTLLETSLNSFINWETGECSFTSDEFKEILSFINSFPEEYIAQETSLAKIYSENKSFVCPDALYDLRRIAYLNYLFKDNSGVYIGYPLTDGSGNTIMNAGSVWGITFSAKNKEICFDFLEYFLREDYQKSLSYGIPVNRNAIEELLVEYSKESDEPIFEIGFEEDRQSIYYLTEEEVGIVRKLIDEADYLCNTDIRLFDIVREEAEAYYCKDKSLDEVCDVIQSRVSIYVKERIDG